MEHFCTRIDFDTSSFEYLTDIPPKDEII
jgi:hypothetical protein